MFLYGIPTDIDSSLNHSSHLSSVPLPLIVTGVDSHVVDKFPFVPVEDRHPPCIGFQILVRGVGFLMGAQAIFIISLVIVIMTEEYKDKFTIRDKSLISTAFLVGNIVGQLLFGTIGDYVGRTKSFVCTLVILIVGSVASALAYTIDRFTIFYSLSLSQFLIGVGVGGEFPISATVSSEASHGSKHRGRHTASVFSMQAIGSVLGPVSVLILLQLTHNIDLVWRIGMSMTAVPGLCLLYFRVHHPESHHYHTSHAPGASRRQKHAHKWRDIKDYKVKLFGTSLVWFIFNVIFYSNSLFSTTILSRWFRENAKDNGLSRSSRYCF